MSGSRRPTWFTGSDSAVWQVLNVTNEAIRRAVQNAALLVQMENMGGSNKAELRHLLILFAGFRTKELRQARRELRRAEEDQQNKRAAEQTAKQARACRLAKLDQETDHQDQENRSAEKSVSDWKQSWKTPLKPLSSVEKIS